MKILHKLAAAIKPNRCKAMGIRLCIEQFWPSENEGGYDGHWIYQFELQV